MPSHGTTGSASAYKMSGPLEKGALASYTCSLQPDIYIGILHVHFAHSVIGHQVDLLWHLLLIFLPHHLLIFSLTPPSLLYVIDTLVGRGMWISIFSVKDNFKDS